MALTTQVEQLNIDIHTQSLRVEVERVKRQKLRATLKRVSREVIPSNHILFQVRHDMAIMQEQVITIRCLYESEIARLGILSYRCFSRLHQLLISITIYISMSAIDHTELSQLVYEFLRTTQLFKAHSDAINFNEE